ncbi:hypothetical protein AB5N19_03209 [Seiridium cardinale]|uniref:LysM domain-containing protein n=1 Tax=Seiridium cardinale TaxID=138064 RepID=A0ABR2XGG7_9PEZI
MLRTYMPLLTAILHTQGVLAFNLYPAVDADKLGKALNISTECVAALNNTIPECDQTLFQMVGDLENYWWEEDNVTALCGGDCWRSASKWSDNITDACYEEYVPAYGKLVPAYAIADRLLDGMNLACLPSGSDDYAWCLTESQSWIGSDLVRADCTTNPSDPTCGGNASAIPSESIRMANVYSDDTLCNPCFVQMLYARVTSPFLTDAAHSEYLVDQLQDICDVCSTDVPDFTVRGLPTYQSAPPLSSLNLGDVTTSLTTTAPAASATCAGQLISSGSGCDVLSNNYGVATGDLQKLTGSNTCQVTGTVCLPAACSLQQLAGGETCDTLAAGFKITTVQFLSWNRNIMGLCDNLKPQNICASAPGTKGSYTLAPPPLGTDADAGNQQRGGQGGIVTPTSTATETGGNAASDGAATAPSPTQDGLASDCNNYAIAKAGDGCEAFAAQHSLSPAQLYAWNPALGLNGANCSTNLWASEYYCIGVRPATTAVTAPGPTQSGVMAGCNKYAQAISGDSCDAFASRNSISNAQLYAWNAVLGSKGENCGTSLWAEEWYCVGIAAAVSTTTTTPPATTARITPAGPTQTGIALSCNKYAAAASGDSCSGFATKNGITVAQLYTWNTVLGANGANCATMFWANEYYCVGVS